MTLLRRHILPLMLSLLVVLTGQAAAVAHAAPAPSGRMELCTGTGPVMVYLDEDGEPMSDPVYCPDFALSLILGLESPPVTPVAIRDAVSYLAVVLPATISVTRDAIVRGARGPPVLI